MTEIKGNVDQFVVSDIPLVAFLRYKGFKVSEIKKKTPNKCDFVFHNIPRQLLNDFNADAETVEPKMFASLMRQQIQAAKRVCAEQ